MTPAPVRSQAHSASLDGAFSSRLAEGSAGGTRLLVQRRGGAALERGAAVLLLLGGLRARESSGATGGWSVEMRTARGALMDTGAAPEGPYLRYAPPEARAAAPANQLPGGNGSLVAVSGAHFGAVAANSNTLAPFAHRAVAVGGSVSAETLWTSDSSLACRVLAGLGGSLRLVVTIENQRGSAAALLSYDAPRPVAADPTNLPGGGGAELLTVAGSGHGAFDASAAVRAGATACEATGWASDTSVTCAAAAGRAGSRAVALTAARLAGTASLAWSFDAPAPAPGAPASNLPASGGAVQLWLASAQLAPHWSAAARVGGTAAARSEWVSSSSVACLAAAGTRTWGGALALTAAGRVGTATHAVSYDAPALAPGAATKRYAGPAALPTVELHLAPPPSY